MLYHCPVQPWHVAASVDRFGYVNLWENYVGGVLAMTTTHYKFVNGFSNQFWGWGGEDDDMYNRIVINNLGLARLQGEEFRMMTLGHVRNETGNEVNLKGTEMVWSSGNNLQSGLSSLSTCRYRWIQVLVYNLE